MAETTHTSVEQCIADIASQRNKIRTKLANLNVIPSDTATTAKLSDCAAAIESITGKGSPNVTVQEGESYTIEAGYYTGGTVSGVAGGGNYAKQAKEFTPDKQGKVITPDDGYYGLSQVTVAAIPVAYQDVTEVTATASDVLAGKKFVTSTGTVTAGTMVNRGNKTETLSTSKTSTTLSAGYYSGGTISITTETKSATPTTTSQDITPSTNKVLSKVTVAAIPGKYADASATTATAADIISGKTAIGYNSTTGKAVTLTGSLAAATVSGTSIDGITKLSQTVSPGYLTSTQTISFDMDPICQRLAAI